MSSVALKNDIKIIVIGAPGTGKTSYVSRWTKNVFSDTYKATIVSDFGFKIFEELKKVINFIEFKFGIWLDKIALKD